MKRKHFSVISLALIFSLLMSMQAIPMPVCAATTEDSEIVGMLVNPGDTAIHEVQINHALYPEAVLYAISYGGTGNATIRVYDENDSLVTGIRLMNQLDDNSLNTVTFPKGASYIRSTEATTKKYKITVETDTGDAGYRMTIGTMDTYVENFGGRDNATTVSKNKSPAAAYEAPVFFRSRQTLLNDGGDWYRYIADGYTYITARINNKNCLAFDVYDAEHNTRIYRTTSNDRGIETYADSSYQGYVQTGLELENGKEYLIKFYSTSYISDTDDTYGISIGNPFLTSYKYNSHAQKFYVPANITKTFYIDIPDSDVPASARASRLTSVLFTTGSSLGDAYVDSCKITAPNGYTFFTDGGRYQKFDDPSTANYLTNPSHVPIRGRWKVTIRTSNANTFSFKICNYCSIILGNDGN